MRQLSAALWPVNTADPLLLLLLLLLLQDMGTLSATLEALACHAWAHTYTILLAMESKEVGAAHKAGQLQEQFGCSFHSIVFTLHVLDPTEMPGKASNVNSAVRQFYHMVTGDRGSYMMTIMDAGGRWCGVVCLAVR
jgi:hypothetical protein